MGKKSAAMDLESTTLENSPSFSPGVSIGGGVRIRQLPTEQRKEISEDEFLKLILGIKTENEKISQEQNLSEKLKKSKADDE